MDGGRFFFGGDNMIEKPMDVLTRFPVRKSQKQKKLFRDEIQSYVSTLGYESQIEKGSLGARNLVIGNPDKAKYLITAHYDTPAFSLFPNVTAPTNFFFSLGKIILTILLFTAIACFGGYLLCSGYYLYGSFFIVIPLLYTLLVRFGPANKSNVNDNSSGVITVLEILSSLDPILRKKVCFVLFDLEEAGLIGSASFRKAHHESTDRQIIFNLDCVSDGDELLFFPSKALKQDTAFLNTLRRLAGSFGRKHIHIHDQGFHQCASDHIKFPRSVGIGSFRIKKGVGLYLTHIHTPKDIVLDETNINILRAYLISVISQKGGSYEPD